MPSNSSGFAQFADFPRQPGSEQGKHVQGHSPSEDVSEDNSRRDSIDSFLAKNDVDPDADLEFDLDDDINALLPFDFGAIHLIPLSSTLSKSETELPQNLTFWSGLAMIVGMSIGSGIFASPGPVFTFTKSVGAALSVWVLAGLLAVVGGLCYAELGTAIPSSGGEHPYLMRAYGSLPAFLFSWTGVTVTRPGSVAIITVICAEYTVRLILYAHPTAADDPPSWLVKLIAICVIAGLTTINCVSTKLGTRVQDIFTILKLLSLLIIGAIGVVKLAEVGVGAANNSGKEGESHNFHNKSIFQGSSDNAGDYALALYSALWAYDGWNNLNNVAGELRNPTRDLPRAITAGPLIVIVAYVLANIAYYAVLPAEIVRDSNTIAMDFGKRAFGHFGGIIIPLIVIGSTLGAANASIFSGARVAYVSARSAHAPAFLAKIHSKFRTPFNALLVQGTLSCVFIIFGNFTSLVNFYSMIAWSFYFLAVVGLVILRVQEPHLERPYRVWIVMPFLFLVVVIFLLTLSIREAPMEALYALAFTAVGLPFWYIVVRKGHSWESKFFIVKTVTFGH
ncbi:amino acid permease-domain-containing protein [Phlyctochytrium arcticum]|nr:amino acid permease-domain-containing protein [Phlyctochytrium arcticum]